MPIASRTASLNLAGCAVARQTVSERAAGGTYADGGVRIQDVAVALVGVADLLQGLGVVGGCGVEIAANRGALLVRHLDAPGASQLVEQGANRLRVFAEQEVQVALEIGGDLNIHGRTKGRMDLSGLVDPRLDEAAEDVIAVGRDDKPVNREPHALGHVAGEDIAEITGRDREADPVVGIAPAHPPPSIEVVDHLGQDARPVDGIDRPEVVMLLELQIVEQGS